MRDALPTAVLFGLVLAVGCKGCVDGQPAALGGAAPAREQQGDYSNLSSRLAARKLDLSKSYPKDDGGQALCDEDLDCFLAQAERCAPAVVTDTEKRSAFGVVAHIESRYTIAGSRGADCLVYRDRVAIDARVKPKWAVLLKRGGKTDDEIESSRQAALASLRAENPARYECKLTKNQLLSASLDLADRSRHPEFWHEHCVEAQPPEPQP